MFSGNLLQPRKPFFWICLVLLAGAIFRTIAWLGATSLWLDEVASALNIQSRSFSQLFTEKLEFNQVAPIGFLWTSKLAAMLFGENDLAFRFVPWMWSIISLPLFYSVAKRFLSGWYLFAAVAFFSLSYSTFIYAFQAKQYSGDLAIALMLCWIGIKVLEGNIGKGQRWLLAVGIFVGLLSSFQAVVIAFLIAIFAAHKLFTQKRLHETQYLWPILLAGFVSALVTTWFALNYNDGVRSEMTVYWNEEGGFPSGSFMDYLLWIPKKLYEELGFFIAWSMYFLLLPVRITAIALLLLSIPGTLFLSGKKPHHTGILFSTILVALFLAIIHRYPFEQRVGFYASFVWAVTGMAGLQALATWRTGRFVKFSTTFLAVLFAINASLLMIFVSLFRPPYYAQPMQPVLKALKQKMLPGDMVYVYPKARWAMQFYAGKEGISNYTVQKSDGTLYSLLRDADRMKGHKRVWFVFTQWTPSQPYPDSIKSYLGTVIGRELDRIPDPFGLRGEQEAAAHLYDLSGSTN